MVATQPQFCDALEFVVVGHHLRYQMAVVVDNGHFSRMVMEKVLCNLGVEQEVLVIELFHNV